MPSSSPQRPRPEFVPSLIRLLLEADAMTWEELTAVFDQEASPPLAVPREQVVRRRLKRELIEVLRELLLVRLGIG